ncbi:MFS transporter [Homoserinibacter sp. GY 40078]|uniref:MFS transporter n=1 Tax=Homoserinibacter sp. GY 40078 TaxID=2603275 RepID=UPI0011C8BEA1|nr:MFS transporter [Homoserinibacter sp. GY 40078]TXK19294.1 MFS transporter [Homoserinibacter sp. GY 40078]
MSGRTWMLVTLAAVSAFSAMPSAFYGDIATATGTTWSTALLFSGHGLAAVIGMSVAARLASRLDGRVPTVPVLVAVVLDVAGGVVLALNAPQNLWILLVARLICGFALGIVTPLASSVIVHGRRGSARVTAAIFGGVGVGSLASGALIASGASISLTVLLGLVPLLAMAASAAFVRQAPPSVATGALVDTERAAGLLIVVAAVVGAFLANGVLALFTSLLPAAIADLAGGASLYAGLVGGSVMIAAGTARLAFRTTPGAGTTTLALVVIPTLAGTALLTAGLLVRDGIGVGLAVLGGVGFGLAAGVLYDASLRAVGRSTRLLATVQRGGQAGLVIPPLVATAVTA